MSRMIGRALAGLVPVALAAGLMVAAVPAKAGYYTGYSYGQHGYGYGRSYGYGYGRGYGYSYRPYYRPYGYHGYAYRPYYRPHYAYRSYGRYQGGLLHGLLSLPGAVVGAVLGNPHHPDSAASTPPAAANTTPAGDGSAVYRGAWASLAEGHYARALAAFVDEASSHPNQGRPKVGYALSAAAGGDLVRGVWAMRRALRIDPNAMHSVTVDGALRHRVEQLIARYVESADYALDDAEATFMLASLYYLLRESDSARNAVKVALAGDASSPSTVNLVRIIERDLTGADAQAPATEDGGDY